MAPVKQEWVSRGKNIVMLILKGNRSFFDLVGKIVSDVQKCLHGQKEDQITVSFSGKKV